MRIAIKETSVQISTMPARTANLRHPTSAAGLATSRTALARGI
jgi:hypothetical protein